MQRRQFLAASLATSAVGLTHVVEAQAPAARSREFYQLRHYSLRSGPQLQLAEDYFGNALIPALTRMGMGPVGAFRLEIGPSTPDCFLLIPSASVEPLAELDLRLADDAAFLKAAETFRSAPANSPAFQRVEASLLAAFEGWPKVTPPASAATKGKRIFQLRTYESPSDRDHARKVEMFHSGEFETFKTAGFHPVFFGDMLIGTRMPNLTYMLSFANMEELEAQWAAFSNDPAWKKLSADSRYGFEPIVDNISNLILSPLQASQI